MTFFEKIAGVLSSTGDNATVSLTFRNRDNGGLDVDIAVKDGDGKAREFNLTGQITAFNSQFGQVMDDVMKEPEGQESLKQFNSEVQEAIDGKNAAKEKAAQPSVKPAVPTPSNSDITRIKWCDGISAKRENDWSKAIEYFTEALKTASETQKEVIGKQIDYCRQMAELGQRNN